MASPTQWTWVGVSSGRWWRTGKPAMLQSMGVTRVKQDWLATTTNPDIYNVLKYEWIFSWNLVKNLVECVKKIKNRIEKKKLIWCLALQMYLLKYSNRDKNIFTMKICGLTLFGILTKTSKETTTPKKRPSEEGLSTQFTTKPGIQSRWVLSWNVDFKVLLTKAMMVILHHSSSGSKVYSNSVQMFFCMK